MFFFITKIETEEICVGKIYSHILNFYSIIGYFAFSGVASMNLVFQLMVNNKYTQKFLDLQFSVTRDFIEIVL